eukprot:TRINITY_DN12713_c0_g1_i1.p1 TRINITY_DN12713_c0_g1~~TRINITY_DN12713_c0_g1_i1.p1  ORF type:complete len:318 (-),score=70.27 TRINITY_DN12713_c0_g1_i1:104-1057(-)
MQDLQGLGSASTSDTPAWCWRLWHGGIVLSAYIERNCKIAGTSALELGSGTGLVSLVAARCGAAVVATDLPCAMGLLRHNANANFMCTTPAVAPGAGRPTDLSVRCPDGHVLAAVVAEHEDYMCNVCDCFEDEVQIGDTMHCCRDCDFDVCHLCYEAGCGRGSGEHLPSWFTVQCCGAGDRGANESFMDPDTGGTMAVQPLDFTDEGAVARVLSTVVPAVGFPSTIIVADCTYDHELHEPLVNTLCQLREAAVHQEVASCTLLLLHDPRTEEIDNNLFSVLKEQGIVYERVDLADFQDAHERSPEMHLLKAELIPTP